MESKLEENFTVTDSRKMENPMSKIVIENFGDWRSFRNAIKDAWKNADYDPRENKFSQRKFTNEILQSYADKINPADFRKLSNLITKEINALERHKEKSKSVKEKYVQRDMRLDDREREVKKAN